MISILTINTALQDIKILGRSVYRPVNYIDERLTELARQLLDLSPDIICVQELFHPVLQKQVYELLKLDYPYAAGFAKNRFDFRLGNELLVFSKFPINENRLYRFNNATIEERIFTSKGFFQVTLESPVGVFQLINFHMTAGGLNYHPDDPRMEKIRSSQIKQLIESITHELPAIIVGDLNAGPDSSKKNYQSILDEGFIDAFGMTGNTGLTWDPENPLVVSGNEHHLHAQRIDHIFMNNKALDILKPESGSIVMDECFISLENNSKIPVSDHYGLMVRFNI